MRLICWNLKNISANKLNNSFQPLFQSYGLGNNVLDYIVNVVMGSPKWSNVMSNSPADIFVIIELKTGGSAKGADVSGNCIPTLDAFTTAMNTAVGTMHYDPLKYHYAYVTPVVTGLRETVGFIYNDRVLTATKAKAVVERDTVSNTYLPGRTPMICSVKPNAKPNVVLQFSSIHDQPPSGGALVRMRPPINYCVRLPNTPTAQLINTFFVGDFNCDPADFYTNGNNKIVRPFTGLLEKIPPYKTALPGASLSSVRKALVAANPGKSAYLNAAYDNAFYRTGHNISQKAAQIADLIGNARNFNVTGTNPPEALYPLRGRATLNAFNTVSDHLPVIFDFDVV